MKDVYVIQEYVKKAPEGTLMYKGMTDNDVCVFEAGVSPVAPGIGELWIVFILDPKEYIRSWMLIKSIVNGIMESGDYHRLQSHVLASDAASLRFDGHLGLIVEGLMHGYINKDDYFLMARVNTWQ